MKKGISLIVLVITIVVIIVLAAAVILSLGQNSPINSARKSVISSDLGAFKSELMLTTTKKMTKEIDSFDIRNVDAEDEDMLNYIPSMKDKKIGNKKYTEILIIEDGKLKLKEEVKAENYSELPKETVAIIEEAINGNSNENNSKSDDIKDDRKVLTASEIMNKDYIGKEVIYTSDDPAKKINNVKWKLYGTDIDNETNTEKILLIADTYVDLENDYKGNNLGTYYNNNSYTVNAKSSSDRKELINFLLNPVYWEEYAINSKTVAYGGPTIKQFCASYKALNTASKYVEYTEKPSNVTGENFNVYGIKWNTNTGEYGSRVEGVTDPLYRISDRTNAYMYWIASAVQNDSSRVYVINQPGVLGYVNCNWAEASVRPIVCLKNAELVEDDDGKLYVK